MIDNNDVAAPICGEIIVGTIVNRDLEANITGVSEIVTVECNNGCRYRVPESVVVPA